jgi:hypothetical protein
MSLALAGIPREAQQGLHSAMIKKAKLGFSSYSLVPYSRRPL